MLSQTTLKIFLRARDRRNLPIIAVLILISASCFFSYLLYWHIKTLYLGSGLPIPRYTFKDDQVLATSKANERLVIEKYYNNRTKLWDILSLLKVNDRVVNSSMRPNRIAVVTGAQKLPGKLSKKINAFGDFSSYSVENLLMYSNLHGYALFFLTGHLMDNVEPDLLWAKIDLVEHYLRMGYDWVVWTDLDVLLMNFDIRLETFLEDANEDSHFVGVLECGRFTDASFHASVRAGFFMIRNSPLGFSFLSYWKSLKKQFLNDPLLDQAALSEIVREDAWRKMLLVHPSWIFHTYCECYQNDSFSVHFPNTERKWFLPQWYTHAPKIQSDFQVRLRFS